MMPPAIDACLVLVPAYNAAAHLPELIDRLDQFVCRENLLVVNDGSTDATETILCEWQVRHLTFVTNRGKGAALAAGYRYAVARGYRSVLSLDADLQHLPEELPRFYAADDGAHLIIGTRRIDRAVMPTLRWLVNNLTSLVISIFSGRSVRDSQSGFRLVPTDLLAGIPMRASRYDFETEILFSAAKCGVPVSEIPVSTVYASSRSYINPMVDTGRFLRQLYRFLVA